MPERNVVKGREHLRVHSVRGADLQLLGVAGPGARNELVGDEHVPAGRIELHMRDDRGDGVAIACEFRVRKAALHLRAARKGQRPETHLAVIIADPDGLHRAVVGGRDRHARGGHQPCAEGETLRRVVVAADHDGVRRAL